MLPHEIEPFADHHIKKLREAAAKALIVPTTSEEMLELQKTLNAAAAALERFKICMADEVKQKARYRKYAKENGYQYS